MSVYIEYVGHQEQITGVSISKLSVRAFTCSEDKNFVIWDLFNGSVIKFITCNSPIVLMEIDKIESAIFLACQNKNVYVYPVEVVVHSSTKVKPAHIFTSHSKEITAMALSNDGNLLVGEEGGFLSIWKFGTDEKDKIVMDNYKNKGNITNIISAFEFSSVFGIINTNNIEPIPFLNEPVAKAQKFIPKYTLPSTHTPSSTFTPLKTPFNLPKLFTSSPSLLPSPNEDLEAAYFHTYIP